MAPGHPQVPSIAGNALGRGRLRDMTVLPLIPLGGTHGMPASYTIIPDGLKTYGVEVAAPDRFLSVRGFATELEAAAWIAEQRAGEAAVATLPARETEGPWYPWKRPYVSGR